MVEQKFSPTRMETSFPRGGSTTKSAKKDEKEDKTSKSKKRSSTVMEPDFLFGRKPDADRDKTTKRAKKSKSSSLATVQSLLPVGGGGVVVPTGSKTAKAPIIEALGFSKLAKNTKILATVRQVTSDFIIFSLPNLLTGYMLPPKSKNDSEDSSNFDKSLKVGQTLAVCVQKVVKEQIDSKTTKRRIEVTALPAAINVRDEVIFCRTALPVRGQITSIEDHGCLVDLGLGRKGFLKFEDIQGEYTIEEDDEGEDDEDEDMGENQSDFDEEKEMQSGKKKEKHLLCPGRLLDFHITSTTGNRVYSLKLPSRKTLGQHVISPPPTSKAAPYTLASITPGWLVNAKVEAMAKNGICVTFLGNVFRGAIEMGHVGAYHVPTSKDDVDGWKTIFQKHKHFPARVVAVDVPTKLIRLSLLPHLIELQDPPTLPSVGSVIENCTVIRTDPGIGALLALPEEMKGESSGLSKKTIKSSELFQNLEFQEAASLRAVYVHISKALDGKKESDSASVFGKEFAPSTKHSVRILSDGNLMDGVASGACAPSIVEAHVLAHSDLKAGQLYKQVQVAAQLKGGSILVELGGSGIRALIPPIHLADANGNNSEYRKKIIKSKFAVGAKVDVRVLWVDPIKKKCLATAKKTLIKAPESEIVASYDDMKLGNKAVGFVSKVESKCLYVTFFNKVYGVVTARSLAAELGMESIQENYSIGDAVSCRIVKLNKRKSRKSLGEDSDEEDNINNGRKRAYMEVTLSLKVENEGMAEDNEADYIDVTNPKKVRVQTGSILPLKAMKIVELVKGKPKKNGSFVPGYAIVSIKSKHLVDDSDAGNVIGNIECKLPYDQILDEYEAEDVESVEALDALGERVLKVGKKINQRGIILTDPGKSNVDYSSGLGKLAIVSIRKKLIEAVLKNMEEEEHSQESIIIPSTETNLFVGALLLGFVAHIDARYGAFVRFLDGLTGLIPKKAGGLNMRPYDTVVTKVKALDKSKGQILLLPINPPKENDERSEISLPIQVGDTVDGQIDSISFSSIQLTISDETLREHNIVAVLHSAMKNSETSKIKFQKKPFSHSSEKISRAHPFYGLKTGQVLKNLTIAFIKSRGDKFVVHLTDREVARGDERVAPVFVSDKRELKPGMVTSAFVSGVALGNAGLYVEVSPFVKGFIPGLELSTDANLLNDIKSHVAVGSRIACSVLDSKQWNENRAKNQNWKKPENENKEKLILSALASSDETIITKPARGDLVVGRASKNLKQAMSPSMMVALRGGFVGRCCITELEENDEWVNMPLGRILPEKRVSQETVSKEKENNDGEEEAMDEDQSDDEKEAEDIQNTQDSNFSDGKYVECRVLQGIPKHALVDISLRSSRIEGDLDDDVPPAVGDIVQSYVVETNKKGCFVRLSRTVEGRVTLKELCDGYLPDPGASFPPGRLVVGKVKEIREVQKKSKSSSKHIKFQVDMDMRESTLLDQEKQLTIDDIVLGNKYKGVVTRVESYGVFVQIEKSNVSGLSHLSECSDKFVKNLGSMYDPGDLVKVLVIKKDAENRKLGFSMKASHFEDDEDSDEDSSLDGDEVMLDSDVKDIAEDAGLDSDDDNFASKLAASLNKSGETNSDDDDDDDSSENTEESSAGDEKELSDLQAGDDSDDVSVEDDDGDITTSMSAAVGFDWDAKGTSFKKVISKDDEEASSDDSDSEDSDSDNDDTEKASSHKSRKKQAQRRREEREISRRELALADGTADENPETAGDFERMLAGNPNSSELWIRYMAFYLSIADIPSARKVAEKALSRIEFRQETEKLNVWTALLNLEHKYGTDDTLQKTVDRACGQCNPKQVYLRVCEILEKDATTAESVSRANEMYTKMCKKFKSKKKVWLAHLEYLLKQAQHQEAHALLKRALLSLASYKHAETMSKFAQLEFEYGSHERARTVFDGILQKYPKRLDLFFVYLDKETKFGKIANARALVERKVEEGKLSEKQMKSLFKKWYRMEEIHGTREEQEHVKETAREYVQRTSS